MNWIPLIGVVLFVGLGVGWRSWLQRRRHGSYGIALFRSGDLAQHVREAGILVLVPLLAARGYRLRRRAGLPGAVSHRAVDAGDAGSRRDRPLRRGSPS